MDLSRGSVYVWSHFRNRVIDRRYVQSEAASLELAWKKKEANRVGLNSYIYAHTRYDPSIFLKVAHVALYEVQ